MDLFLPLLELIFLRTDTDVGQESGSISTQAPEWNDVWICNF